MLDLISVFEIIARKAASFTEAPSEEPRDIHPFDTRDIHPMLQQVVRDLFDDGHYAQATFEAFKFVDNKIQRISGNLETGYKLMMMVFAETSPSIKLTACSNTTEKDEQKGYQFLFAGSMLAIRNPRGHKYGMRDDPDTCMDHLSLASMLLRRLEKAGYKIQ
jgi:uncharacterized protein (TIGR02391 family)